MAQLLKGNAVVGALAEELSVRVMRLKEQRVMPTLAILRVGDKEDDIYYQQSAVRRCESVGVAVESFALQENVTEEQLLNEVMNLNLDDNIHGVLILRPLPAHIDDAAVCAALAPEKDVDGITDRSLAGVVKNEPQGFPPCTAEACVEVLKHYNIPVRGARAVVIGRSLVVGKPVSLMLTAMDATVTVCHTKTVGTPQIAEEADILIVAAGRPGIIDESYVKPGAVVIDVGTNVNEAGKLVGDVNFAAVERVAGSITPVPGGVGAVTTAMLVKHTVEAAERSLKEVR